MALTIPQIAQYGVYLGLLVVSGALEYFKVLPANSTAPIFFLIVGHFFGNTPAVTALTQNTKATQENTQATVSVGTVPAESASPAPEPKPIILSSQQQPPPPGA